MSGRHRLRVAALVGAAAVVALAAGVVAGRHLTSPGAAAAHAKAPPARDVVVRLTRRALTVDVTATGRRRPGGGLTVAAGNAAGPDAVVTAVDVETGERLADGMVLADVAGAPLFTAVLPFPLYRDIAMGDSGPDVVATEGWLGRLGYLSPRPAKVDAAVLAAVAHLLRDHGYAALLPSTVPAKPAAGFVVVHRSWIVRIDRAGRRIDRVGIRVGSVLADPAAVVVKCDTSPPAVLAVVDHAAGARIRAGDAASVLDNASGSTAAGTVSSIARPTAAGVPVTVAGEPGALASLSNDLVVTVTSRLGNGAVLAAPVTALYTDVDGTTHVLVPGTGAAGARPVSVTLGPCAEGWCQIVRSAQPLAAGDPVVVGAGNHPDD